MRESGIEGEQDYQSDIAHDSCPNDDADFAPTETQGHRGNRVCKSISEAGEDSKTSKAV